MLEPESYSSSCYLLATPGLAPALAYLGLMLSNAAVTYHLQLTTGYLHCLSPLGLVPTVPHTLQGLHILSA